MEDTKQPPATKNSMIDEAKKVVVGTLIVFLLGAFLPDEYKEVVRSFAEMVLTRYSLTPGGLTGSIIVLLFYVLFTRAKYKQKAYVMVMLAVFSSIVSGMAASWISAYSKADFPGILVLSVFSEAHPDHLQETSEGKKLADDFFRFLTLDQEAHPCIGGMTYPVKFKRVQIDSFDLFRNNYNSIEGHIQSYFKDDLMGIWGTMGNTGQALDMRLTLLTPSLLDDTVPYEAALSQMLAAYNEPTISRQAATRFGALTFLAILGQSFNQIIFEHDQKRTTLTCIEKTQSMLEAARTQISGSPAAASIIKQHKEYWDSFLSMSYGTWYSALGEIDEAIISYKDAILKNPFLPRRSVEEFKSASAETDVQTIVVLP